MAFSAATSDRPVDGVSPSIGQTQPKQDLDDPTYLPQDPRKPNADALPDLGSRLCDSYTFLEDLQEEEQGQPSYYDDGVWLAESDTEALLSISTHDRAVMPLYPDAGDEDVGDLFSQPEYPAFPHVDGMAVLDPALEAPIPTAGEVHVESSHSVTPQSKLSTTDASAETSDIAHTIKTALATLADATTEQSASAVNDAKCVHEAPLSDILEAIRAAGYMLQRVPQPDPPPVDLKRETPAANTLADTEAQCQRCRDLKDNPSVLKYVLTSTIPSHDIIDGWSGNI